MLPRPMCAVGFVWLDWTLCLVTALLTNRRKTPPHATLRPHRTCPWPYSMTQTPAGQNSDEHHTRMHRHMHHTKKGHPETTRASGEPADNVSERTDADVPFVWESFPFGIKEVVPGLTSGGDGRGDRRGGRWRSGPIILHRGRRR